MRFLFYLLSDPYRSLPEQDQEDPIFCAFSARDGVSLIEPVDLLPPTGLAAFAIGGRTEQCLNAMYSQQEGQLQALIKEKVFTVPEFHLI